MSAVGEYIKAIKRIRGRGNATESSYRLALQTLLESAGKEISATNEPKRIKCGAPDFQITRRTVPLGHIETKDLDTDLDEMERGKGASGEQFIRYRDRLPNWVLTDYLEFRWYVGGEKRMTVRVGETVSTTGIKALPEAEGTLLGLLTAFYDRVALTVQTAKDLARRLAEAARIVRGLVVDEFAAEKERGWLHNWLAAFQKTLIPDLDEAQFADMFAQTVAYGYFAAKVHAGGKPLSRESAARNLPKTNPFLRKFFAEIAGIDMPDAIVWAVDDVVALLNHADMASILENFGKGQSEKDPVVHFYETFLTAYDPRARELRGVYYTPMPVVDFIVRSIDSLLVSHFGRAKGLADKDTTILDPAVGTATFLYAVIQQIHRKFTKQKGGWNAYVSEHLLRRIFGFEILMAPYAVAYLKLGMLLRETGYEVETGPRFGIYLTNALDEGVFKTEQLFAEWVAEEANAAAGIKREKPILVVLGNPPYSKFSANRSEDDKGRATFIGRLIEDYRFVDGKPLGERNPKWLQDDYVKFMRFAQWRIERTGEGIVGLITNHGYLDNPTFRGMRRSLLGTFDEIYVYNLHGNARKKEKSPDGSIDENVFDIQQGVAIILCVRKKQPREEAARVCYADLWGPRESKYDRLASAEMNDVAWATCNPASPAYLFVPQDTARSEEFAAGWLLPQVFPVNASTVTTARNDFSMAYDPGTLLDRIDDLKNSSIKDAALRDKYGLRDVSYWKLSDARREIAGVANAKEFVRPYCYRPFDFRFIFYHKAVCERLRTEVMQHMRGNNVALLTHRPQSPSAFTYIYCTRMIGDQCVAASKTGGGGNSFQFPLYLYPSNGRSLIPDTERTPNLSEPFLKALAEKLRLRRQEPHGLPKGISAEDVFHYAYAVFHSPAYRSRYAEFLRIDFPRLPLTSNLKLFRGLAAWGSELASLHLMESPRLDDFLTEWPVKGDNVVERVDYNKNDRRVWINKKQYFSGVPLGVWQFHVGGYQVAQKWLKDRKGRMLTYDDTQHYQKIVVALSETIRIMEEIDGQIESCGGWPIE